MKLLRELTLFAVLLLATSLSASAQTSKIEQQRKVVADLERRIANEERELARLKKSKASTEKQVRSLINQIESQNALIRATTRQIKQLDVEIEASKLRLNDLEGQQERLEESVREFARAAYRNHRFQNQLSYIFSSDSFTEMTRRIAMLRVMTFRHLKQIEEVVEVRENVEMEKAAQTKRQKELEATKKRLNSQRSKLRGKRDAAKRAINNMSSKQRNVLRSKMEHEEELNAAIVQLRKLIKGNKAGASFSATTTALNLPVVGGRVKRYKGNMAEIVGKEGAAVTSIYEGKVVDIKRNKVNNKYDVYIAHGEYITSYANLSSVSVTKGVVVQKGQRIGTIGTAVNISTMEMEYKIVFGVYAPKPEIKLSAANLFKK